MLKQVKNMQVTPHMKTYAMRQEWQVETQSKRFLTIAMGASNETSGKRRLRLDGFNREVIDRIHQEHLRDTLS